MTSSGAIHDDDVSAQFLFERLDATENQKVVEARGRSGDQFHDAGLGQLA